MAISKEEFVEKLQEDLALEFKSIVQYVSQIAGVKGAEFQQPKEELRGHLQQEVDHAVIVAQQIDFLGGQPIASVPTVEYSDDAVSSFRANLELEENQLERYRERMQEAEDMGLPDVAGALAPVLEQTQHHVRDLQSIMGD